MKCIWVCVVSVLACVAGTSLAEVPKMMNYQGKLTDASGKLVSDGPYDMIFSIYNASTGGSQLWAETWESSAAVQVTNGLCNVLLGTYTPLDLAFDSAYWLQVQVKNGASWESLSPRQQVVSAAYAFRAEKVTDGAITDASISATAAIADSKLATITASGKVSGSAVSSGTFGTVNGSAITNLDAGNIASGVVPADKGGTGQSSFTKGDILVASGSSTLVKLGIGSNNQSLVADDSETAGVRWGDGSAGAGSAFGSGADGTVTVATNTTLTRDMYYESLTVNNGVEVYPNGWRIFAKDTLTFVGTGKICAYGGNGGNGQGGGGNGTPNYGGSPGAQANAAGSLPASLPGCRGADGQTNGYTAVLGGNGTNTIKAVNTAAAASSGNGGAGNNAASARGTSATNSGTIRNAFKDFFDVVYMRDWMDDDARLQITPNAGGAGGGGQGGAATCGGSSYCSGGGGGGSGATGGIVWIAAKEIITVAGMDYLDLHGGNGGLGGNAAQASFCSNTQKPAGGGGGGAGGNGGAAILVYKIKTGAGTINLSAGAGSSGGLAQINSGTAGSGSNGSSGAGGTAGVVKEIQL